MPLRPPDVGVGRSERHRMLEPSARRDAKGRPTKGVLAAKDADHLEALELEVASPLPRHSRSLDARDDGRGGAREEAGAARARGGASVDLDVRAEPCPPWPSRRGKTGSTSTGCASG